MRALGTDGLDGESISLRGGAAARRRAKALADSIFVADTLTRIMKNDSTAAALRLFLRSRNSERELSDSGFALFGLDGFTGPKSQYDPLRNGPVDDTVSINCSREIDWS